MKKGLKKLIAGAATAMALVVPVIGVSGGQEAKAWHKIDVNDWFDKWGHLYPPESHDHIKNSIDKVHSGSMNVHKPPMLVE